MHETEMLDQLFAVRDSTINRQSCVQNRRILSKLEKHHDLPDDAVIVGEITGRFATKNSLILRVALEVSHLIPPTGSDESTTGRRIATKNIQSARGYIVKVPYLRKDFDSEIRLLTASAVQRHEHIINLFASFTWQENKCLLLPEAQTDLRAFWMQNPSNVARSQSVHKWAMRQIYGLADAIRTIHYDLIENGTPVRGLHGDINPRNILLFYESSPSLGTLRLADLGCSAISSDRAATVQFHIEGYLGSYQSPESFQQQPITQACDLWEFGCLLLDFATWLHDGVSGLEAFAASRLQMDRGFGIEFENDFFFDLSSPTAMTGESKANITRVNVATEKQLANLRTGPSSSILCDLVSIIEQGLLQIKSEERVSSAALVSNLAQLGWSGKDTAAESR